MFDTKLRYVSLIRIRCNNRIPIIRAIVVNVSRSYLLFWMTEKETERYGIYVSVSCSILETFIYIYVTWVILEHKSPIYLNFIFMRGRKRRKINIDTRKRHKFLYAWKIIFHHYERQLATSSFVIFSFVLQDAKRAIHTHEKSGVDSMCNGQFVRSFARFACK